MISLFLKEKVFVIVIQLEFVCHADNVNCSFKSVQCTFFPSRFVIDRCQIFIKKMFQSLLGSLSNYLFYNVNKNVVLVKPLSLFSLPSTR